MSNGWIFISHSHRDIALVRRVRNHFEKLGFEPLMFYLKCLSDESEIETLIRREIDEREWFVYADSPNARESKWVKTEREYIEKSEGKKIFVIDLQSDLESQLKQIEHITRQMKVFISYSHKDTALCHMLKNKLEEKDMQVVTDEDIQIGDNWLKFVSANISDACRDGFVLLLITEHSCKSGYIVQEIQRAKKEKGKIVPLYVGDGTLHPELLDLIGSVHGVHINASPSSEELDEVVNNILNRVEYYSSDFTNAYGYRGAETIHLPPVSCIDGLTFWDCENLKCVYVPNSVVYITPDAFDDHKDVLIKCYAGSYCESYCKKHNLNFEIILNTET